MDPLMRLKAGIDQADVVFGQVRRDQYSSPTPCPDWNVEQLMNHMIGALVMFRDVATQGVCRSVELPVRPVGGRICGRREREQPGPVDRVSRDVLITS